MRVLMLSWEYPPHIVGGLGAHVAELVPALSRQGVEVELVTPRWKGGASTEVFQAGTERSVPATIHRVDPPVGRMGNFFADVQQTNLNLEEVGQSLWEGQGFDLIHAHDWLVAFAAASLKRIHKMPLLATIHATERGRGGGSLYGEMSEAINGTEWWLTYEAWRVITASAYMAQQVRDYFQVPSEKIDIIHNGVDAARFDALEGMDLLGFRSQWAASQERIVFFVGRLVHEKGAHLIVEAAPQVLAQFPETRFIIAGTGPMREELRERAQQLGIGHRVNLAGFLPDDARDRLLKVAQVGVFPSLYEPFGIVALEAMAARCPVVVSQAGGLAEVVASFETGITVYPNSVQSLAWGISHTLARPDWARARAENAWRVVKEEFNWDRIARRTAEVYRRLLNERAATRW